MSEIFESATKQHLRFDTVRGPLTAEDLWDLPLTSRNGFDLDTVAKEAHMQLKEAETAISFVTERTTADDKAALRMEVVKRIIAVRKEEARQRAEAVSRAEQKRRLLEILAEKKEGDLRGKSAEELEAMVAAL